MNALDLVLNTHWAMQREPLELILSITRDRANVARLGELLSRGPQAEEASESVPWATWANDSERALLINGAEQLPGSKRAFIRDGVAIVPVLGPIFRRANLLTALSGATSLDLVGRDLAIAASSEQVRAILLDIDSPGGQAAGISELAAHIVAMNRKKPICAYIGGTGASAAYWLASACGGITVSSTAVVGSIGVMAAFEKGDDGTITIVSSQSPKKRPDMETPEGRADVQGYIDDLAAVFVGDVARYRGVSEKTVLADFGQGGVLVGRAAVKAGMVDRTGNLEGTLKALAQDPKSLTSRRTRADGEDTISAEGEPLGLPDGSPTGLSFEDELNALLISANGSVDRARDIAARREGRTNPLSPARRAQLVEAHERLTTLLAETRPLASESERHRLTLQAQALELAMLRASLSGG